MAQSNLSPTRNNDPESCRHHWVIGTPAGPTSEGRCKLCGTVRSFYNVFEDVIQPRESRAA
jgi:hypothetical protein